MVFRTVFTTLLVTVLATTVHASPVASPEAVVLEARDISKRTPGNVYVCPQINWGGDYAVLSAGPNYCNNLDGWQYDIQSFGPDPRATCYAYSDLLYYDPNGNDGACDTPLQNSDFIVALGEGTWDDAANCGDTITVNYNGASVHVTVEDIFPGCHGPNDIDLSEAAMAALDPNYLLDGNLNGSWPPRTVIFTQLSIHFGHYVCTKLSVLKPSIRPASGPDWIPTTRRNQKPFNGSNGFAQTL
ncbi:hypothetical protein B0H11DRAFT_2432789 [Mycena galericulata]|nr:hypothetical protein B0H11DRAFT_2432789 [Mycena galericulata]